MKRHPYLLLLALMASGVLAEPPPPRQAELLNLLQHDCGSCHGLSLKGGLGPPLLPASLDNKPREYLAATILYGRPGTPMPPWRPFVTETEAYWLADRIKEGLQ